jgi:hypothetical protein
MQKRLRNHLILSTSVIVAALFHSATVRAENKLDDASSKPSQPAEIRSAPKAALLAAGVGAGQPGYGIFGSIDGRVVDRLYLGGWGVLHIDDHAFTSFIGARAQYRFAVASKLHMSPYAGVGWLNGAAMSAESARSAFADGLKPVLGGILAYQPGSFMLGLDAFVMPARRDSEVMNYYWEQPGKPSDLTVFAQVSAFVGLAL